MAAISKPMPKFGFPIGPFHEWFAWYPIRTFDHRLVWLKTVLRRRIQKHSYLDGGPDAWWQYKMKVTK